MRKFLQKISTLLIITLMFCLNISFIKAKELHYLLKNDESDKIITEAKKHLGKQYVWGANGPNKFDCSGLVTYVFKNTGVYDFTKTVSDRPTTITYTDWFIKNEIKSSKNTLSDARKGDIIIFYDASGTAGHMGIYYENKTMVHAPNTGSFVKIQKVDEIIGNKYKTYVVYHIFDETGEMRVKSIDKNNNELGSIVQVTYPDGTIEFINTNITNELTNLTSGLYTIEQIKIDPIDTYVAKDGNKIKLVEINGNSTVDNTVIVFENEKINDILYANFFKFLNDILTLENNL